MNDFKVTIAESSRELSAREKIKLKDITNAVKLDEATQCESGKVIISPDYHVALDVHNPSADNPDYELYMVVDKNGTKYITGSTSFWSAYRDIYDELTDAGETDFEIAVYRCDSKNYKGKQFITCSLM